MKILMVYKDYCPPIPGGIEGHLALLCNEMKRFFDVEALVCGRRLFTKHRIQDGVPITEVGELGRILSAPIAPTFPLWLKRKRFDLIHYQLPNPTADVSHLLARPPGKVVVSYQSDVVRQAWALPVYEPFLNAFLRRADRIIVSSENYLASSAVLREFRDKCVIIPLGIDLDRFASRAGDESSVAELRAKYGGGFVLFLGVLRQYKGVQYLIQAAKKLDAPLVIAGTGPCESDLKQLTQNLGLAKRVHFAGAVTDDEKRTLYQAASVFVLPSIYRSEAFGISLVEATACGLPCVSTRLGTGTDFVNVHNQTGLVVRPADADELAAALKQLLDDPALCRKFGAAARERAQREFGKDMMIERIKRVYLEE